MWWRRLAHRQFFHTRSVVKARETVNVPSMGDSISEGTVVELSKPLGSAVASDEVVVVLETDKISIDVRSPTAGVLSRYFAAVDDTVNVGSKLFEIDSEGSAVSSRPPIENTPTPTTSASPVMAVRTGARTPLIKFLGKRSLLSNKPVASTSTTPVPAAAAVFEIYDDTPREGTLSFSDYPAAHLPISSAEAHAIATGYAAL